VCWESFTVARKRSGGRKERRGPGTGRRALRPGVLAALVEEGRLEEAVRLCREALEALAEEAGTDTRHRLHHNLAVLLHRLGRFEEADRHLNEALALEEGVAESHFLRGLMRVARGETASAVEAFSRALSLRPGWPAAHLHRGVAYFALGDYSRARSDFQAAREALPEDPVVLYDLALADCMLGRWEEAQGLFRTLAAVDAENASGYYELLAQTYRAQTADEVYGQVHRLKNMMGMVGDRLRLFQEDAANLLDPTLRRALVELSTQFDLVYYDLAALLGAVRREPLGLEVTDLHQLIDAALVAGLSGETRVEVIKDYQADLPDVVCDPQLIREAFLNLILNALEAMQGDGVLSITTGRAGEEYVYVIFVDTGPGVAAEDAERIFHLGYSTKPFGSGIGLAQVRRDLAVHGGKVEVTPGGPGATFTVYLPRRPRLEPSIEDLSPKARLPEDARMLLLEPTEGGELLL